VLVDLVDETDETFVNLLFREGDALRGHLAMKTREHVLQVAIADDDAVEARANWARYSGHHRRPSAQ